MQASNKGSYVMWVSGQFAIFGFDNKFLTGDQKVVPNSRPLHTLAFGGNF